MNSNIKLLKGILSELGYPTETVRRGTALQAPVGGPYRLWLVNFTLDEQWLSMNTYVCALPATLQGKWRLAETLLRYNDKLCALKYTLHEDCITLDVQCRAEHVDRESVEGYFGLLLSTANEHYPNLMRELTGEKILENLGKQLQTASA